jgi:menaquinone-dependent protoporphyrinogen oxidase
MKILVAYASRKGSTQEVASTIGEILETQGHQVSVQDCDEVLSVESYDAFVLGTGIYAGRWLPAAETFLRKFGRAIAKRPLAVFILCVRILEPNGHDHVLEHYLPKYLLIKQEVISIEAFAGRLNTSEVDWQERWTLTMHYDGSIDHTQNMDCDYRDWSAISAWAESLANLFNKKDGS